MGRVPSSSYQVTSRQAVRRHLENRQLNAMTRGQSQQGSGSPSGSDTLTIPAISLPAHGLDHSGCLDEFAVFGGGVLAAAIGMVDKALRWLLPLDGHGQGRGGLFRPHVITHRPANNLPGARIEHGRQVEPAFTGWQWSKKRTSASPPRTVRAPFSAYGSPFKPGPWPLRHPDIVR